MAKRRSAVGIGAHCSISRTAIEISGLHLANQQVTDINATWLAVHSDSHTNGTQIDDNWTQIVRQGISWRPYGTNELDPHPEAMIEY